MSILTVRHSTVYRYREPVIFGEHRIMFRPRESHDLRLIGIDLSISTQPVSLRWLHDAFDNSLSIASFESSASELRFESTVTLEHFEDTLPDYTLEEYARTYSFHYSDEDSPDLIRALNLDSPSERAANWAVPGVPNMCFPCGDLLWFRKDLPRYGCHRERCRNGRITFP